MRGTATVPRKPCERRDETVAAAAYSSTGGPRCCCGASSEQASEMRQDCGHAFLFPFRDACGVNLMLAVNFLDAQKHGDRATSPPAV